jgi:nucleoside triphosphatase
MQRRGPQRYPEPTVGGLILNKKRELLLVESPKWKGGFTIPGGHVEVGETLVEALQRELREEVGLNVEDPELLMIQEAIFSKEFYKKRHFIFFDYVCRAKGVSVKVDGEEITGYRWVTPREALKLKLDAYTRRSVAAVVERFEGGNPRPRM